MFNMRGFSANNSLFVDGVRDDGLIARDVFNLEQIEVFSGPTGSDVGRTNAAGYINLTTKTPNLEGAAGRHAQLRRGRTGPRDGRRQPAAGARRAAARSSATRAVRVNALWQDGGIAGRDYAERESKSIAPSIAFGLNTPTRASVVAPVHAPGQPRRLRPAGRGVSRSVRSTPTSVVAATPVDQSTYYGSPDYDYDKVEQDNVTRAASSTTSRRTSRCATRRATTRPSARRSSRASATPRPTTRRPTSSRSAVRRTSGTTTSSRTRRA